MTNATDDSKKILVVDDEVDIGFLMRTMLQSAGHQVTHVKDIASATEALETSGYDTVFLDLNLDGEFGLDLVPVIRASSKETSIAVITAQKAPEVRESVRRSGVDTLIEKPFNRKKILAVLDGGNSSTRL